MRRGRSLSLVLVAFIVGTGFLQRVPEEFFRAMRGIGVWGVYSFMSVLHSSLSGSRAFQGLRA